MWSFWTAKAVIEYIPYSSKEEYYLFILKFLILTHLLPLICGVVLALHQDYYDFYVEQRTGKAPVSHEKRLQQYYELREYHVSDWQFEAELLDKQADQAEKI